MFCDIVFPQGNEQQFIAMAEKLGIDGIAFAYLFSDKKSVEKAKETIQKLQGSTKIILAAVFRASGNMIYKVHDLGEIAIADASRDSREVIARYQPDLVYDLELSPLKDFAKSRNSGLDKATAQFVRSNNIIVAFSFSSILNSGSIAQLLARLAQNIRLCRKFKLRTAIASFAAKPEEMRSPHDLRSFLLAMGMYTENAKKSIESVSEMLKPEKGEL